MELFHQGFFSYRLCSFLRRRGLGEIYMGQLSSEESELNEVRPAVYSMRPLLLMMRSIGSGKNLAIPVKMGPFSARIIGA